MPLKAFEQQQYDAIWEESGLSQGAQEAEVGGRSESPDAALARTKRILATLAAQRPDLICLQVSQGCPVFKRLRSLGDFSV